MVAATPAQHIARTQLLVGSASAMYKTEIVVQGGQKWGRAELIRAQMRNNRARLQHKEACVDHDQWQRPALTLD